MPKLALVFSTDALVQLQNVIADSGATVGTSPSADSSNLYDPLTIDQVLIAPLGQSSPSPRLFVNFQFQTIFDPLIQVLQIFMRSGQLTIYDILPTSLSTAEDQLSIRSTSVAIKFVKIISRSFEITRMDESEPTILAEHKRINRSLVPFQTVSGAEISHAGVFFLGDRPCWILATDKDGLRIHPSGHNVVHAFTSCSLWQSKGDFLMYTEEVMNSMSSLLYVSLT